MTAVNKRSQNMDKSYNEWRKLSLKDKINQTMEAKPFREFTSQWMSRAGALIFWYSAVTVFYCAVFHVIPEYCTNSDPMTKYYYKVASTFLMIQTCANWLCVYFYSSVHSKTRDKAPGETDLVKSNNNNQHFSPNGTHSNGSVNVQIYEDQQSDRTGLVWSYCQVCDLPKPPRSHHCPVCKKCILKRDHHCFFTNTCIGFYNQRYFVILNFYIALSTAIGLILDWKYLNWYLDPDMSWWGYFLPNTLYHWWFDQFPLQCLLMISHFYIYIWCIPMASGFFIMQLLSIYMGKTTHELYTSQRIKCFSGPSRNFRDVFGIFWGLNFFFPTVLIFRQEGDGKHWKYLKQF